MTDRRPELIRCTDVGLLVVEGEQSRTFLQGQLTCDVQRLAEKALLPGACCTPQGRIVANFWISRNAARFSLVMPVSQLQPLQRHLEKYAPFFPSVTLSERYIERWSLVGDGGAEIINRLTGKSAPDQGQLTPWQTALLAAIPYTTAHFELWLPAALRKKVLRVLGDDVLTVPAEREHLIDIRAGVAWVTTATQKMYTPSHLNWSAVGGVSFTKGCYTGQEIVARMHYLGKLKSRLYRFALHDHLVPAVGAEICNKKGQFSGAVVAASRAGADEIELLAVVKNSDVAAGEMAMMGSGEPLSVRSLPYDIPSKSAAVEEPTR